MTNGEKYRTPEDRAREFEKFCKVHDKCDCTGCPLSEIKPDCDDCVSNRTCDYLSRFADRIEKALKVKQKKSPRKYEYNVKYIDDRTGRCTWEDRVHHYESIRQCRKDHHSPLDGESLRFLRREVGEWEEVPNA